MIFLRPNCILHALLGKYYRVISIWSTISFLLPEAFKNNVCSSLLQQYSNRFLDLTLVFKEAGWGGEGCSIHTSGIILSSENICLEVYMEAALTQISTVRGKRCEHWLENDRSRLIFFKKYK